MKDIEIKKKTPTKHRQGNFIDLIDTLHDLMDIRHDKNL